MIDAINSTTVNLRKAVDSYFYVQPLGPLEGSFNDSLSASDSKHFIVCATLFSAVMSGTTYLQGTMDALLVWLPEVMSALFVLVFASTYRSLRPRMRTAAITSYVIFAAAFFVASNFDDSGVYHGCNVPSILMVMFIYWSLPNKWKSRTAIAVLFSGADLYLTVASGGSTPWTDLGPVNSSLLAVLFANMYGFTSGNRADNWHRNQYAFEIERNTAMTVLERELITDFLTGVPNRRHWNFYSMDAVPRVRRGEHISVMVLDIDKFKSINDTYSHDAGDHVLKAFCAAARACVRPGDCFARLGGEEFGVVVVADIDSAMMVAERIRSEIENMVVPVDGVDIKVTVSIGVSSVIASDSSIDDAHKRADLALYASKNSGRNRVSASYVRSSTS